MSGEGGGGGGGGITLVCVQVCIYCTENVRQECPACSVLEFLILERVNKNVCLICHHVALLHHLVDKHALVSHIVMHIGCV